MDYITEFLDENFAFNWCLKGFNLCEVKTGTPLQSCKFPRVGEYKNCFYLYLYPKGVNEESKDYVSLFVFSEKEMQVRGSLSLFCNDIEKEKRTFTTSIDKNGNGYHKLYERHPMLTQENDQHVILMVRCTVGVISSKTMEFPNSLIFPDTSKDGRNHHLDKLSYESCREHFSDVELVANGTVFPAHRIVLTSHSKVFAAMFQHDTKEKQTSRVEITDFKVETVHVALQHTYSGKFSNVTFESALEVLTFSDMYDLSCLREECSNYLSRMVSVGKVHDVLVAADVSNASELKAFCLEFIYFHLPDTLIGDKWKLKYKSRPHLLEEIIEILIRDKKERYQTDNK